MPVGSPGMDGAIYGNRVDPYSVMLLAKDGSASVYQQYPGKDAHAQATAAAPTSGSELTAAEVRKVDKQNKKVTLKHDEIKSLDMPAMTMVYQVADPSALNKLQPGDKVRFRAVHEAGKYTVTEIQPVK
jgi:Cu/Ag efflux protein CusF